ncbi:hypothetical protein [Lysinibacillus fusiformis]|uniref:hypothetical protein n=1 Tax=Lysinibacillus fusiformis TaxID=28031 RepID=UPI0035C0F775|nr:hypothetical protein QYY55_12625 [Lysinibacillus fusiformis]
MKYNCLYANSCGLEFEYNRYYKPEEFFIGKTNSRIWVIGTNPRGNPSQNDSDTATKDMFMDFKKDDVYFKRMQRVSKTLYNLLGQDNGAGHTDIVRCFSLGYTVDKMKFKDRNIKTLANVEKQCLNNLEKQLNSEEISFPEMIYCHGIPASLAIRKLVKIPLEYKNTPEDTVTSYIGTYIRNNDEIKVIRVVLSGMIHQMDRFSKARLGVEIDTFLKELKYDIEE